MSIPEYTIRNIRIPIDTLYIYIYIYICIYSTLEVSGGIQEVIAWLDKVIDFLPIHCKTYQSYNHFTTNLHTPPSWGRRRGGHGNDGVRYSTKFTTNTSRSLPNLLPIYYQTIHTSVLEASSGGIKEHGMT